MWLSAIVGMRLKLTHFTPNCRQLQCDNVWWSRPDWDFNFCLTPVKTNRSSAADFSRVRMIYHQSLSVPCDVSVRNSCKNWLLINASFLPAVSFTQLCSTVLSCIQMAVTCMFHQTRQLNITQRRTLAKQHLLMSVTQEWLSSLKNRAIKGENKLT